jgi:hypothetical protein
MIGLQNKGNKKYFLIYLGLDIMSCLFLIGLLSIFINFFVSVVLCSLVIGLTFSKRWYYDYRKERTNQ